MTEPMDVRYNASRWSRGKRRYMATSLRDRQVSYRWEGDELVVSTSDEAVVDELLDEVDWQPPQSFLGSLIDAVTWWI